MESTTVLLDGWHVDVAGIHSAVVMDLLLDSSIESSTLGDGIGVEMDEVAGLYDDAGFMVVVDGEIVSHPTCCSSFCEALRDWRVVVNEQSSDWSVLWIGHPWQMVRVVDRNGELSLPMEGDDSSVLAGVLSVESLRTALDQAEHELHEFVVRFADRLQERGIEGGVNQAKKILGVS